MVYVNCESQAEFLAAMVEFYRRVDGHVAMMNPTCRLTGRCCRFGEYGHKMYVTEPELAYFLHQQAGAGLRRPRGTTCPYQQGRHCTVRDHRPLGCRVYFCDPSAKQWQGPVYEESLEELKGIGRRFGITYHYREWIDSLRGLR